MRLISSGIVRSRLLNPASTCASLGIKSLAPWSPRHHVFLATSAHAAVEFTSPTTSTRCGSSFRTHTFKPLHYPSDLNGMRGRAHSQAEIWLRKFQIVKNQIRQVVIIMLPVLDEDVVDLLFTY